MQVLDNFWKDSNLKVGGGGGGGGGGNFRGGGGSRPIPRGVQGVPLLKSSMHVGHTHLIENSTHLKKNPPPPRV